MMTMALLLSAFCLAAPPQDVLDFLGSLTEALSNGDAAAFLAGFDPKMENYPDLRRRVEAMLAEVEVAATVEVRGDESKADRVELDAEWAFELRARSAVEARESRSSPAQLVIERRGRRWIVTRFDPISVFGPMRQTR